MPSILTIGVLVYGGDVTAGLGVLLDVFVDSTAYLLTIPAAGIKSPNFLKKYKTENNWISEIITIPE